MSKYFYDDAGIAIFQDIMKMPDYYLTDCEYEIFSSHKENITMAFANGQPSFDLVELGSGDRLKTKILPQRLSGQNINFQYVPVDISEKALASTLKNRSGLLCRFAMGENLIRNNFLPE